MGRDENSSYRRHERGHLLHAPVNGGYQQVRGLVDYLLRLIDGQLVTEYLLIVRYLRKAIVQEILESVQTFPAVRKSQAVHLFLRGNLHSA